MRDVGKVKEQAVTDAEYKEEDQATAIRRARIRHRGLQLLVQQREARPEQHAEERHELARDESSRDEVGSSVECACPGFEKTDRIDRAVEEGLDIDQQDACERGTAQGIDARVPRALCRSRRHQSSDAPAPPICSILTLSHFSTDGKTNLLTSPPSVAISRTIVPEMNWY